MGFEFVGCEIDQDYFNLQEERFRKECLGIQTDLSIGKTIIQHSLFN